MPDEVFGRLRSVWPRYFAAQLAGDAAVGATTLALEESVDLDPEGGWLRVNDDVGTLLRYESITDDVVTLAAALAVALPAETLLQQWDAAKDAPGSETKVLLDMGDGNDSIEATLVQSLVTQVAAGERQKGQGEAARAERKGPAAPWRIVDVFGVRPTIDSDFIDYGDINTSTTPSIPNGTFEQPDPLGLRPFAKWRSYASAGNARLVPITDGGQIAGSTSAGAELDGTNSWLFIISDDLVPVHGGDEIRARVTVSADRDMTYVAHSLGYRPARMILMTSTDASDPADVLVGTSAWTALGPAPDTLLADEETTLSGSALVPDGHQWMRLALRFGHPGDGLGPATPIADEFARIDLQVTPEAVYLDSTRTFVNGIPLDDYIRAALAGDTFTFTATDSTAYDGSGNSWSTERLYQGYTGARGQRKAAALFDQAAIATAKGAGTFTEGYWLLRVKYAPVGGRQPAAGLPRGHHPALDVRGAVREARGRADRQPCPRRLRGPHPGLRGHPGRAQRRYLRGPADRAGSVHGRQVPVPARRRRHGQSPTARAEGGVMTVVLGALCGVLAAVVVFYAGGTPVEAVLLAMVLVLVVGLATRRR